MNVDEVRAILDNAKAEVSGALKEPGHSPTEDRLIDACSSLAEAVEMLTALVGVLIEAS